MNSTLPTLPWVTWTSHYFTEIFRRFFPLPVLGCSFQTVLRWKKNHLEEKRLKRLDVTFYREKRWEDGEEEVIWEERCKHSQRGGELTGPTAPRSDAVRGLGSLYYALTFQWCHTSTCAVTVLQLYRNLFEWVRRFIFVKEVRWFYDCSRVSSHSPVFKYVVGLIIWPEYQKPSQVMYYK